MFRQTDLSVGESIYGLSERFGAFNKGQPERGSLERQRRQSSKQAYKNTPFWLSSAG